MSEDIRIAGGCLCGQVRFEASEAPVRANYCHCRMCQRATGGPFEVFATFRRSVLRFTGEPPTVYRSSRVAERSFCSRCGTPIGFRYFDSECVSVTLGSLDDPNAIAPRVHDGIESRLSWLRIDDDLPQRETEIDPGRL